MKKLVRVEFIDTDREHFVFDELKAVFEKECLESEVNNFIMTCLMSEELSNAGPWCRMVVQISKRGVRT